MLGLNKKKKEQGHHRAEPLNTWESGGTNLLAEDPSAYFTSWGREFHSKLIFYLLLWLQFRALSIYLFIYFYYLHKIRKHYYGSSHSKIWILGPAVWPRVWAPCLLICRSVCLPNYTVQISHTSMHLILVITQWSNRRYYPHFIKLEIGALGPSDILSIEARK